MADVSAFVGPLIADMDVYLITDILLTSRQFLEEKMDFSVVGSFVCADTLFALQFRDVENLPRKTVPEATLQADMRVRCPWSVWKQMRMMIINASINAEDH